MVDQTVVDKDKGDCVRAAIASMFELEIEQVPHFVLFQGDMWWTMFCSYVWGLGYELEGYYTPKERQFEPADLINGCILASVTSGYSGRTHAVLIDSKGVVIHDPSPCKHWLGKDVLASRKLLHWDRIIKRKATNIGWINIGDEDRSVAS